MTEFIAIDPRTVERNPSLTRAGLVLRNGGLVAFPTETVYGLGGNALDPSAVRRIFAVKGRPADNPLILHCATVREVERLVRELPPVARRLAARFWPGPLTMVLWRRPEVPAVVSAGLPTVAVRIPAHPVALALIESAGVPIAAPSANTSGKPSPTAAEHVLADLDGSIEMIIDAGPTAVGLESTVLDLTAPIPRLLRPGGVTLEDLRRILGRTGVETARAESERPASPGMKYRHYAPQAPMTVFVGEAAALYELFSAELKRAAAEGKRLAILAHSDIAGGLDRLGLGLVLDLGPRGQEEIAAQRLFTLLRACDAEKVDGILAESGRNEGLGRAVNNRLLKAASGRVIKVGEVVHCSAD